MGWYNKQMTRDGLVPGGVGAKIYDAVDQGFIPAEVAPEMIRAFLRAGMDSTISSISGALRYLALDREQWDALRVDPRKARAAFEEATRLSHALPRSHFSRASHPSTGKIHGANVILRTCPDFESRRARSGGASITSIRPTLSNCAASRSQRQPIPVFQH